MKHKSLNIMVDNAEGKSVTFPVGKMPARLGEYTYSAQRMGESAPQVTATLNYPILLKDEWFIDDHKPYIELNGEKYILKNTPTSKKSNDNLMYEHSLTFVAGRVVLEHEYFYDVVLESKTEAQYKDRYRSNLSKFSFMGTIEEFVSRFNDALAYVGFCTITQKSSGERVFDGYHVVIDDDVPTEEIKEVSFEDTYLSKAIQSINTEYGLAYYWEGKVCHVGLAEKTIEHIFEYGSNTGLLTVADNNSEDDIVTRITGTGGTTNLAYYYPNDTPEGTVKFTVRNFNKEWVGRINITALRKVVNNPLDCTLTLCEGLSDNLQTTVNLKDAAISKLENTRTYYRDYDDRAYVDSRDAFSAEFLIYNEVLSVFDFNDFTVDEQHQGDNAEVTINDEWVWSSEKEGKHMYLTICDSTGTPLQGETRKEISRETVSDSGRVQTTLNPGMWYKLTFVQDYTIYLPTIPSGNTAAEVSVSIALSERHLDVTWKPSGKKGVLFVGNNGEVFTYEQSGIELTYLDKIAKGKMTAVFDVNKWVFDYDNNSNAGQIIINGRDIIYPSSKLMPSIYRQSQGAERYYNAKNNSYADEDGNAYMFTNLYISSDPHAHTEEFEDIYPTMRDIRNSEGKLFGEIVDIAFDDNDSDELKGTSGNSDEYIHSYFYIKLNRFDGDYGFNLFEQALESDTAKVDMITGNCAGCSFEIGVTKLSKVTDGYWTFENPVQVNESDGSLVSGDYTGGSSIKDGDFGTKVNVNNCQQIQQDTIKYNVWIALKKENSTFGVVMPNATHGYKPKKGDRFVLTGIKMPKVYILEAEHRLDLALYKYMKEHNEERFECAVSLSRIWLERHTDIADQINENVKLRVKYNNSIRNLYVKSYTVKADSNILNEITVELTSDIGVDESELEKRLNDIQKKAIKNTNASITNIINTVTNTTTRASSGEASSDESSTSAKVQSITGAEILEITAF